MYQVYLNLEVITIIIRPFTYDSDAHIVSGRKSTITIENLSPQLSDEERIEQRRCIEEGLFERALIPQVISSIPLKMAFMSAYSTGINNDKSSAAALVIPQISIMALIIEKSIMYPPTLIMASQEDWTGDAEVLYWEHVIIEFWKGRRKLKSILPNKAPVRAFDIIEDMSIMYPAFTLLSIPQDRAPIMNMGPALQQKSRSRWMSSFDMAFER